MEGKKRPQDRWDEKNGYVTKTFKMYKKTVEKFKAACEKAGVTQSGQVAKMMEQFIREVEEQENK